MGGGLRNLNFKKNRAGWLAGFSVLCNPTAVSLSVCLSDFSLKRASSAAMETNQVPSPVHPSSQGDVSRSGPLQNMNGTGSGNRQHGDAEG